jgi:hypothetical protein
VELDLSAGPVLRPKVEVLHPFHPLLCVPGTPRTSASAAAERRQGMRGGEQDDAASR